jgi:CAAX prenyl protease-like protein
MWESTRLFTSADLGAPWYRQAPEHWLYPLQCVVVGAILLFFRRHYTLTPWRGSGLAAVLAIVGIAVWVLPSSFYRDGQPGWLEWFGVALRTAGFNPDVFPPQSSAWWTTVALRFVRMVVIVPIMEELFWRGFLMRYVQAGDRPFTSVPFGQHSWLAFWVVTAAVVVVHNPPDYVGAFVWGALMYWLAVRTKSLGACITMHAIGNLALGLWVLKTAQWGFW